MAREERSFLKSLLLAGLLVVFAALCRRFAYVTPHPVLEKLAQNLRFFLYAGFFALWGISARRRVVQAQARLFLSAASLMMLLWLTLREFRWHLVRSADLARYLWYAYYLFILALPLLILFVSLSLGRPETWRLPSRAWAAAVPTAALVLLVLTNDLHEWVFRFPEGTGPTESAYTYMPGYYLALLWGVLCAAAAFAVMLSRCRVPRSGRILWLPLVPFGVMLVYIALYARHVPPVATLFDDLTVSECLLFTAFFECCIQSGLILSNSRYGELFRASVGASARITDLDYAVRFAAEDAEEIDADDMRRAEAAPLLLPGGRRLHNMRIRGGHAVWIEDLSPLLEKQKDLTELREELSERNEMLRLEYEQGREEETLREQNRLYDLMQEKTQSQLDRIRALAAAYRQTASEAEKKRLLARIIVLGSYIKRRKDFVLLIERGEPLGADVLESAFSESFRSLALLGVRGAYLVRIGELPHSAEDLARCYDLFEDVLEAVWERSDYLFVTVSVFSGALRCAVETDAALNAAALAAKYPGLRVSADDEGGCSCLLPLKGGAAPC